MLDGRSAGYPRAPTSESKRTRGTNHNRRFRGPMQRSYRRIFMRRGCAAAHVESNEILGGRPPASVRSAALPLHGDDSCILTTGHVLYRCRTPRSDTGRLRFSGMCLSRSVSYSELWSRESRAGTIQREERRARTVVPPTPVPKYDEHVCVRSIICRCQSPCHSALSVPDDVVNRNALAPEQKP